jgi:uncharacterized protein YcbK (DUF882 family)
MGIRNDIQVSKNFKLYEFESPDTGEVMVDPELIERLQKLRELAGVPISINSGYRTKEHNAKVGGVDNSQHRLGKAADLHKPRNFTIEQFASLAEKVGFNAVGKYNTFIHVDVRGSKARWDFRK